MKNLFLSLFVTIVSLPTLSNAQISIGKDLAQLEKATQCYYYNAGFGDQPCRSGCKISGRKYNGSYACENNPDNGKRARALKCPDLGLPNSARCYCECADDANFQYQMVCAPATGGTVGDSVANCTNACKKQGLTFNKAGLDVVKASLDLISNSKYNIQGAPNCEKELNVPAARMCFCDKK